MGKSPITKLLEKFDIKKQDLAILLEVSLPTLTRIEDGSTRFPEKSFDGLTKLGCDPHEIVKEQEKFIADRKKQIIEKAKIK
jgi:hypothetical protein